MKHLISLAQAKIMTAKFRSEKDNVINPEYHDKNILPVAETFERAAIDKLLASPGCVALRIYHGMNDEQQLHSIMVAVDIDDRDILPKPEPLNLEEEEAVIVEEGTLCPPVCGQGSELNP